jgi:L-ascorbate metabolism protein UlaG (beta-lactamase superfamily)
MLDRIHWLGHASFRINGSPHDDAPVIYIDPWNLPEDAPPADVILVSHDHHDHCSLKDIQRIRKDDTTVIANQRAAELIGPGVQVLRPYQGAFCAGDICVRAIPAYTITRTHHAPSFGGLGFLINLRRFDIYFAGDTDLIPEMDKIGCDVALLPVGGIYTMNWEEAVEATKRIRTLYAVPMHYGREIPGSSGAGKCFCQAVNEGVQGIELPMENESFRLTYS